MKTELVVVLDERGVEIFFVDWRDELGRLADSRFFATRDEAEEFKFDYDSVR